MEAALRAGCIRADPAEIGRLAADDMDPIGDVHASVDYRLQAGSTLVGRVLAEALAQVSTEAGNG